MRILLAMLLLLPVATRPLSGGDFELQRFDWTGDLGAARTILVRNDFGDVRLRTSAGSELRVAAVIQKLDRAQPDVRIVVEEGDGGFEIRSVHPSDGTAGSAYEGRVDMALLAPPDTAVNAETSGGTIELRGLSGPIEARTRTGDILLIAHGGVAARTGEGEIRAWLRAEAWETPLVFESVSGDVAVTFPEVSSLEIRAETSGAVTLELPEEAARTFERKGRRTSGTLGAGGHPLRIVSGTGDVRVRAEPASVAGAAVTPTVFEGDLRELPRAEAWRPGDPIQEFPRQVHPRDKPPDDPPPD